MLRSRFIRSFIVLFSIYAVSPLYAPLNLNGDPNLDAGHSVSGYNRGIFAVDLFFSRVFGHADDSEKESDGKQMVKKKRCIPAKNSRNYGTDGDNRQETQACLPPAAFIPIRTALFSVAPSGTRAAPDPGYGLIFSGLSPPSA